MLIRRTLYINGRKTSMLLTATCWKCVTRFAKKQQATVSAYISKIDINRTQPLTIAVRAVCGITRNLRSDSIKKAYANGKLKRPDLSGKKNPHFGKPHTDAAKQKISLAKRMHK